MQGAGAQKNNKFRREFIVLLCQTYEHFGGEY